MAEIATTNHAGKTRIVPGKNDRGEPIFSVLHKRTYKVKNGNSAQRNDIDREFRQTDYYYDNGDPEWSVVQYEYELAPFKSGIDVVVIGKAYAPNGQAVPEMSPSVRVGEKAKTIKVIGDRECFFRENAAPEFSDPVPFTEMEIRYDLAYGGKDDKSIPDIPFFYPRNTMGRGMVLRNLRETVESLTLPNIEDPNDLLTPERLIMEEPERWHMQPVPQGFGWRQRTWYPRSALLGSFPPFLEVGIASAEEKMGLLPKNHIALAKQFRMPTMEAQFNNGASIGLTFDHIDAAEKISLRGLTPEGVLEFALPNETPKMSLDLGEGEKELETRLHTVSIRPDDGEMDLIWRGSLVFPSYRWLAQMKRLHAEVQ